MSFSPVMRATLVLIIIALIASCATPTVRTVPFRIQSDPLGGYVLLQVRSDAADDPDYDWIYLGNTPLDARRAILSQDLNRADSFVIRVMKYGYHYQQKSWTVEQILNEAQSKGGVYWYPRLVPAG